MKTISLITSLVFLASPLIAGTQLIQIDAVYKGFNRALLSPWLESASKELRLPRVTTQAGTTVPIVMMRKVSVVSPANAKLIVPCGITLEVSPDYRDGKIVVIGKSTIRQFSDPKQKQPFSTQSFTSLETYFHGLAENKVPITIQRVDGSITLTFTLIRENGTPQ